MIGSRIKYDVIVKRHVVAPNHTSAAVWGGSVLGNADLAADRVGAI